MNTTTPTFARFLEDGGVRLAHERETATPGRSATILKAMALRLLRREADGRCPAAPSWARVEALGALDTALGAAAAAGLEVKEKGHVRTARFADLVVRFSEPAGSHRNRVRLVGFNGAAGRTLHLGAFEGGAEPAFGEAVLREGRDAGRRLVVRDGRAGLARLEALLADVAALADEEGAGAMSAMALVLHLHPDGPQVGMEADVSGEDAHSQMTFGFSRLPCTGGAARHALAHFCPHDLDMAPMAAPGARAGRAKPVTPVVAQAAVPGRRSSATLETVTAARAREARGRVAAFLEATGAAPELHAWVRMPPRGTRGTP